MAVARRHGVKPKCTHDAVTAEQAAHLVSEQVGVGIVTNPNALDFRTKNVALRLCRRVPMVRDLCDYEKR